MNFHSLPNILASEEVVQQNGAPYFPTHILLVCTKRYEIHPEKQRKKIERIPPAKPRQTAAKTDANLPWKILKSPLFMVMEWFTELDDGKLHSPENP